MDRPRRSTWSETCDKIAKCVHLDNLYGPRGKKSKKSKNRKKWQNQRNKNGRVNKRKHRPKIRLPKIRRPKNRRPDQNQVSILEPRINNQLNPESTNRSSDARPNQHDDGSKMSTEHHFVPTEPNSPMECRNEESNEPVLTNDTAVEQKNRSDDSEDEPSTDEKLASNSTPTVAEIPTTTTSTNQSSDKSMEKSAEQSSTPNSQSLDELKPLNDVESGILKRSSEAENDDANESIENGQSTSSNSQSVHRSEQRTESIECSEISSLSEWLFEDGGQIADSETTDKDSENTTENESGVKSKMIPMTNEHAIELRKIELSKAIDLKAKLKMVEKSFADISYYRRILKQLPSPSSTTNSVQRASRLLKIPPFPIDRIELIVHDRIREFYEQRNPPMHVESVFERIISNCCDEIMQEMSASEMKAAGDEHNLSHSLEHYQQHAFEQISKVMGMRSISPTQRENLHIQTCRDALDDMLLQELFGNTSQSTYFEPAEAFGTTNRQVKDAQNRCEQFLNNKDVNKLWEILQKKYTQADRNRQFIGYDDYLKVKERAGEKFENLLTSSVFLQLHGLQAENGYVDITSLINYVTRKEWLQLTFIHLSIHDSSGQGFLKESELESYILELVSTVPRSEDSEENHNYASTAARVFSFFLDSERNDQIRIHDVLACGFLEIIFQLRNPSYEDAESNWFSLRSATATHAKFLKLDEDRNGELSKADLKSLTSYTSVFIDRLFAEYIHHGEMNYKLFLDLELAKRYIQEPHCLQYFFRILDIYHLEHLTPSTLKFFLKDIQTPIRREKDFDYVIDDIFNMIEPKESDKITMADIMRSGKSKAMVFILIDSKEFWRRYNDTKIDNRLDDIDLNPLDEFDDGPDDANLNSLDEFNENLGDLLVDGPDGGLIDVNFNQSDESEEMENLQ